MGRVKKNRGRRDEDELERMHWTPLQQSCGHVAEWGWNEQSCSPPVFVEWCLQMLDAPCLWCGGETGVHTPRGAVGRLRLPNGGNLYTREVRSEERRNLGAELTRQALELRTKVREDDTAGVLVGIPAKYQRVMRAKGFDPAETWIEMRMTDIFLNLGRVTMTDEMIGMLPEPKV